MTQEIKLKHKLNYRVRKFYNKLNNHNVPSEEDRSEFVFLMRADKELKLLSKDNIKRMLILQRKYKIVPYHRFYLYLDME